MLDEVVNGVIITLYQAVSPAVGRTCVQPYGSLTLFGAIFESVAH